MDRDLDSSSHSDIIRGLYTDDDDNNNETSSSLSSSLNQNLLSRQRPKMSMMQRLRTSTIQSNKPKLTTTERIRGGAGDETVAGAASTSASQGVLTAIAPVVSQIWFFPVVALLVTGVFTAVQVSNHITKDEAPVVIPLIKDDGGVGRSSDPLQQRQQGNQNDFFSKVPTPINLDDKVMVPTTIVLSHNEPKFPDLSPTMGPVSGIITIKTKTKEIENPENEGGSSEVRYKVPFGTPTTVPWGIEKGGIDYKVPLGTPTTTPWFVLKQGSQPSLNQIDIPKVPAGTPTTVPWLALQNGAPTDMMWKVPAGTPTTTPWMRMKNGSPTNIRFRVPAGTPTTSPWGQLNVSPVDMWKAPVGTPTTQPWADLQGSPLNMRWKIPKFPEGQPTTSPWGQIAAYPINLYLPVPKDQPTTAPFADLKASLPINVRLPKGTPTTEPWGASDISPIDLHDLKVPDDVPTTQPWHEWKDTPINFKLTLEPEDSTAPVPRPVELGTPKPSTPSPTTPETDAPTTSQPTPIPGSPTVAPTTTKPTQKDAPAPTPYPTETPPTPFPTQEAPSEGPPTPFPTHSPPTMHPVAPPVEAPVLPPAPEPQDQDGTPTDMKIKVPQPQPQPQGGEVTVSVPGGNIPVQSGQTGGGGSDGGGGGSGGGGSGGGGSGGGGSSGGGSGGGGSGSGGGGSGGGGSGGGGSSGGGGDAKPRPPTTPGPTAAPCFYRPNLSIPTKGKSNQDDAIYEIYYTNPLKLCGTILEIGAGDGMNGSPSYFFDLALGWKSIVIEADPIKFASIAKNRPNAVALNGAFCENDYLEYYSDSFHAVGGAFETISEINIISTRPKDEKKITKIPCLQLSEVFRDNQISHQGIDIIYIQISGVVLSMIRAMDWTVRTSIWVIEFRGDPKLDGKVREVLLQNHYVKAKWSIQRWCTQMGQCMKNEVYLKKGFNPLPVEDIKRRLLEYKREQHR